MSREVFMPKPPTLIFKTLRQRPVSEKTTRCNSRIQMRYSRKDKASPRIPISPSPLSRRSSLPCFIKLMQFLQELAHDAISCHFVRVNNSFDVHVRFDSFFVRRLVSEKLLRALLRSVDYDCRLRSEGDALSLRFGMGLLRFGIHVCGEV
ncbi:hypothetical protein BDV96DRAFT_664326 [Lophiotrema nucula]|uniref:Uncharacterized protein n=1 Tax=Lophiotrema nucula TaxID=690887 RepID=A0A6A5Z2Q7_9PLEO|nr:hypothetical protein BDV96DRAFT_664326 [Lophiotrema nucula]